MIGSSDECPYMRSGGHFGVGDGSSCLTPGACGEEPNTSGIEVEDELSETWSVLIGDLFMTDGVAICSR